MGHLANLRAASRRQKTIDDPLLNRLGLQAARTAAAHAAARARRWPAPADPDVARWVRELRAEGCLVVTDVLPAADLAAIQAVARRLLAEPGVSRDVVHHGANQLDLIWRRDVPPADRAVLDRFYAHPRVLALVSAAERIAVAPGGGRCVLQQLTQHDGAPDREAAIHSDTFHPTHKLWLYLTDVTDADGPLVYHPRSHRLDGTSLRAVHRESQGPNAGSRRIGAGEIARRGLAPTAFTCPAGTLVAADTSGYHGRLQGRPPGSRLALQIELRPEPFRRGRLLAEDTSTASAARGGVPGGR